LSDPRGVVDRIRACCQIVLDCATRRSVSATPSRSDVDVRGLSLLCKCGCDVLEHSCHGSVRCRTRDCFHATARLVWHACGCARESSRRAIGKRWCRMSPLVDVVIPTRDRPEALVECLEALSRQTVSDIDAIVVDDGSERRMEEVLTADLRSRLSITVLRHPVSRGPAAARNRAVRHGVGRYVAFVDD